MLSELLLPFEGLKVTLNQWSGMLESEHPHENLVFQLSCLHGNTKPHQTIKK